MHQSPAGTSNLPRPQKSTPKMTKCNCPAAPPCCDTSKARTEAALDALGDRRRDGGVQVDSWLEFQWLPWLLTALPSSSSAGSILQAKLFLAGAINKHTNTAQTFGSGKGTQQGRRKWLKQEGALLSVGPGDAIRREIKAFQAANPLLPAPARAPKVLGEGRRRSPAAYAKWGGCGGLIQRWQCQAAPPCQDSALWGCLLQDLPMQQHQELPLSLSPQHTPAASSGVGKMGIQSQTISASPKAQRNHQHNNSAAAEACPALTPPPPS